MVNKAMTWYDTALARIGLVRRSQVVALCDRTQEQLGEQAVTHIINAYLRRNALNEWNPPDTRGH